jgi:hypothetical protein
VARDIEHLLQVIFQAHRRAGRLDLEAIEMAARSAMHRAGAAASTSCYTFRPSPTHHTR